MKVVLNTNTLGFSLSREAKNGTEMKMEYSIDTVLPQLDIEIIKDDKVLYSDILIQDGDNKCQK